MELTDAFNDNANFSKLSSEPLKIDKFVQKAFIEVNEEGAEAAAASSKFYIYYYFQHCYFNKII